MTEPLDDEEPETPEPPEPEILNEGPADAETFVVKWLGEVYRAANTRRPGDPLPFLLIQQVAGKENLDESTADPVVQVDILCDKVDGEDAARDIKDRVHRRMLLLGRYLEMDGTLDWMKVFESPRRLEYTNDKVIRYTARYQFGQTYEQIA
ncbi:tail terminator [Mycobacterium phage TelAviv]|uniref:Tail terminator n=3 Tax=Corndogvirus TaxID=1623285 RepID=Q856P6_BPMCO|nr:head-tail adaptor [Mycobacterium phage Corndog]YP_009014409.1 head-tail adaptor [Mycobacterium phage Firecracker]ATW60529.1 head-to-tail connector protein [Mycobacterium phage Familton]AVI04077.1 head-to-tail connector [Mycobacterium phage JangDynasty]AVP42701.1 head-to-tail connector complex protein [Mycobacterium phage SchoolBus]QFP96539.1 tail terminator [Mycobacterium phage Smooch]QGJ87368.1 tail terminator [Mycobacterium phage Blessica]QPO16531.1 tail terminator [Mycobacterium phage 